MSRDLTRSALVRPKTVNEAERSVELTIATSDLAPDGIVLRCSPAAVSWPAVVPVLLDHQNSVDRMAGRLESIRFESGQLIGRAVFTDAPAADAGWALARSGVAVSVGAQVLELTPLPGRNAGDEATKWSLRHAALTPQGADQRCITRSKTPESNMTASNVQITEAPSVELERSAKEVQRERDILRAVGHAGLGQDVADRLIESGDSIQRCHEQIYTLLRDGLSQSPAGHPARKAAEKEAPASIVQRGMSGERLEQPFWLELRDRGLGRGRNAVDVMRSALSTSDLPALLTESGNRELLQKFRLAQGGILAAAQVRPLVDYRNASILDAGQVGRADRINEGGEITFGAVNESRLNYRPFRYGTGLSMTPEAMVNDDLQAFAEILPELAEAALDAEKVQLVALLTANSNAGAACADGLNLFDAAHNNIATGGLVSAGLGTAVQRLRNQTNLGGRFVDQEPGFIICGTANELVLRQLLATAVFGDDRSEINPWSNLEIQVEPRLGSSFVYLVSTGPRKPLQLGRVTEGPVMTSEVQFSTGIYRSKVEHSFGVAVSEYRTIVRLAV